MSVLVAGCFYAPTGSDPSPSAGSTDAPSTATTGGIAPTTSQAATTDVATTPAITTGAPTGESGQITASTTDTSGEPTTSTGGSTDTSVEPGALVVHGGIGTLGVRPPGAGDYRVVDDGLEIGARACGGQYCLRGWIRP